jgi:hypothetical protein
MAMYLLPECSIEFNRSIATPFSYFNTYPPMVARCLKHWLLSGGYWLIFAALFVFLSIGKGFGQTSAYWIDTDRPLLTPASCPMQLYVRSGNGSPVAPSTPVHWWRYASDAVTILYDYGILGATLSITQPGYYRAQVQAYEGSPAVDANFPEVINNDL